MEAEAEKDGKKAAEDTAPKSAKEVAEELKNRMEEAKKRSADALEAIKDGRGVLELETPIEAGGETLESLSYDFTKLTGLDYIDAMDLPDHISSVSGPFRKSRIEGDGSARHARHS